MTWEVYDLIVDGEVVYVGMTSNPALRKALHRSRGVVDGEFIMRTASRHPDCPSAALAEKARIARLNPKLNRLHRSRYAGAKNGPARVWDQERARQLVKAGWPFWRVAKEVGVWPATIGRSFGPIIGDLMIEAYNERHGVVSPSNET